MWWGTPKIVFVLVFVINCVLWSQSRYGDLKSVRSRSPELFTQGGASKGHQVGAGASLLGHRRDECRPVSFPVKDQCSIAQELCPHSDTFLSIPYLQHYFCSDSHIRPLLFTGYIVWLIFLFSTLGISASDFFCPNLATLSHLLGLDENVAGVTFLAFGNGSPDVFSTFAAMRSNSAGLAIGDLLGAALFVTSCVVGSMCIIKPFKVDRGPFLRDVGFFTFAVMMVLVMLWDNEIKAWEAASMIALYAIYVTVVVIGSYLEKTGMWLKQEDACLPDEFQEEGIVYTPYRDEPEYVPSLQVPYTRTRSVSAPGPPPRLQLELPPRPQTRCPSPQSFHSARTEHHQHHQHCSSHSRTKHMPSFSLIGALEFRRVVSELQQHPEGSLSLPESPIPSYPGGHYHPHRSSRPRTPIEYSSERDPWDARLELPFDGRSTLGVTPSERENGLEGPTPIIKITNTPASPLTVDTLSEEETPQKTLGIKRQHVFSALAKTYHILFPTLHDFQEKSLLGKLAAVFAVPAMLALTLTLPVVVTDHDCDNGQEEKVLTDEARLVHVEEEAVVERTIVAEDIIEEELHELKFNKWLMATQCILGPLFCVTVLFDGTKHEPWFFLAAGVAGTIVAILVAAFAHRGDSPAACLARCAMGFVVAIVWVMAIADEVVEVLQTIGLIFGLSDAIIGLTIFAIGSSLADLVANTSVAVFAPIMGFSACFGGPMMNILLGIGISGSSIIRQNGGKSYPLHFSTTLVITGTGLLALLVLSLVFVPWNGYFLPRSWGVALIVGYIGVMMANVVVEVTMTSS
ncbi:unnamed protein product [Somion occarium]|uniref:Sodium/calcium exchanger membrane region domain-containing protein n=1 Tax=Somion occarium TaxID=3059160 RepID=A0ABP1DWG6_9APHY